MSTQTQTDQQAPQNGYTLAEIPIERIVVSSNNPRKHFDEQELDRLAHAIATRGFDHPVLVKGADEKGRHELIGGERRWRAAAKAGVQALPALIKTHPSAPGEDLVDAILANDLSVSLDLVEEALGYQALLQEGRYTRKGIAETLKIPLSRVRERLLVLDLPPATQARLLNGEVPLLVVKTLAQLAKIHVGLPELAVKRVVDSRKQGWREPLGWDDLIENPISLLIGGYDERIEDFPEGVFVANCSYPLDSFSLDDAAAAKLAELCVLAETEPEHIEVYFGEQLLEQARSLGAAHRSANGSEAIIVGSDVANQLAGDYLAAAVKRIREDEDTAPAALQRASAAADSGEDAAGEGSSQLPAPTVEQIEQGRRRALEEDRRLTSETIAANQALGAALVERFATVKLDVRVVKILSAAPIATGLADIAARGARLCFPGFAELSERKNGSTKAVYPDAPDAEAKAREYLQRAESMGEVAARVLALLGAARWAKQDWAISRSKKSNYTLSLGSYFELGVPWRNEAEELLDQILVERLPEEIAEPIAAAKAQREAAAAEERRRERQREKDVARFLKGAAKLTRDERQQEIQRLRREHGYSAVNHVTGKELMELPEPHEELELAAAA